MDIKSILFLDIETIPEYKDWHDAPSRIRDAWISKTIKKLGDGEENQVDKFYKQESAFLSEYGKIVCVSMGVFQEQNEGGSNMLRLKLKSFFGKNEKDILNKLKTVLDHNSMNRFQLCAHNGKGFDFPFLANRYIINNIPIPQKLQVWNKKPWELTQFVDTMELWKFGKFRGTSLDDLTLALGISSPKEDMDGSMVAEVYYKGQWKRLVDYCEGDVLATVRCFQRMNLWTPIEDSRVDHETKFA
jgi:predicted PolB exonuclease-like 3'-5' exonuclease